MTATIRRTAGHPSVLSCKSLSCAGSKGPKAFVLEKLPRFLKVETQGRGVDLQQLVLRTQCRQWQGRLCSA